jgi:hypothetical protein
VNFFASVAVIITSHDNYPSNRRLDGVSGLNASLNSNQ